MNSIKSKKNTVIKWFGAALLTFALIISACSWYLSLKLKPTISAELKDIVLNATDSLYTVKFSKVKTNFVFGNAALVDVELIPDTNRLKVLVERKTAPNNIFRIKLARLHVKDFHSFRFYREGRLNINEVVFEKPCVEMINRQYDFNDERPARPRKSPYEYISKFLKELRIKTISFKEISFKYVNENQPVPQIDSINNLNITLKDWLIDQNSATDPNRLYLLKDVHINVNDYRYATADSMYHVNVNQMNFTASTGLLSVKKFDLTPRYSEMDFGKVAGYARDRFHIEMSDISFNGINLPLYIRKQEFVAKEMNINDGFVSVFNNNELEKGDKPRTGKYPHQLLQRVQELLTVDKINLQNIAISYAEYDRDSKQKGKITFERTSGTILNATNSPKVKKINPYMIADLNTYMMGQGKLTVRFRFDLTAPDGAFSYNGLLTKLDGKTLNRITRPLGMVHVNRGYVNSLSFNIDANDKVAKGKMDFNFKDLSVALLKKEEGRERLVRQGWMSLLANALVINSDNPDREGNYLSAPIEYQRNEKASFFAFIWRTLFVGIKHSVGITDEKEEEINATIEEFEKRREERLERKEERLERKQQRQRQRRN